MPYLIRLCEEIDGYWIWSLLDVADGYKQVATGRRRSACQAHHVAKERRDALQEAQA